MIVRASGRGLEGVGMCHKKVGYGVWVRENVFEFE